MQALYEDLVARGVLQHRPIYFRNAKNIDSHLAVFPGTTVVYMGKVAYPCLYWCVHADDGRRLAALGYVIEGTSEAPPAPAEPPPA